jgi:hypothetical protein
LIVDPYAYLTVRVCGPIATATRAFDTVALGPDAVKTTEKGRYFELQEVRFRTDTLSRKYNQSGISPVGFSRIPSSVPGSTPTKNRVSAVGLRTLYQEGFVVSEQPIVALRVVFSVKKYQANLDGRLRIRLKIQPKQLRWLVRKYQLKAQYKSHEYHDDCIHGESQLQ